VSTTNILIVSYILHSLYRNLLFLFFIVLLHVLYLSLTFQVHVLSFLCSLQFMFTDLSSSLSPVVNFYCPAMVVTDKLLVGLLTSHTDFSIQSSDLLGKSEGGGREDQRAG
jgi:hypothetical protein